MSPLYHSLQICNAAIPSVEKFKLLMNINEWIAHVQSKQFTTRALYQWIAQGHSWHDDVIKWKHFPHYWTFVRGIHRSPVNSPHKGQWRGALMFSLVCVSINGWVNNRDAGDLRRYRAHYDVTLMITCYIRPRFIKSLFNLTKVDPNLPSRASFITINRYEPNQGPFH